MATIAFDRLFAYSQHMNGVPEALPAAVSAACTAVSPGSILSFTSASAHLINVKGGTETIKTVYGLAEFTTARTATVVSGTLRPVRPILPGDVFIGSIKGSVTVRPPRNYKALNRTDSTNSLYYGVLGAASITGVITALCFVSDMGQFTIGGYWVPKGTSAASSGVAQVPYSDSGVSGDTNPRVLCCFNSSAFAAA